MNNTRIARILIVTIFLSVGLIVAPPFNQIVSAINYGTINNTAVSTYEIDPQEGRGEGKHLTVRLNNSNYYATCLAGDTGSDQDGFIRTFRAWSNNGTIQSVVVDSYEWIDAETITYASIEHVNDSDIYVVTACRVSTITVRTFKINDTGDIKTPAVSQWNSSALYGEIDTVYYNASNLLFISCYKNDAQQSGYVFSLRVHPNGIITNLEATHPEDYMRSTDIELIDSNTVIIAWHSGADSKGKMMTCDFNSTGALSIIDSWTFDSSTGLYPYVIHIADDIYAIIYALGAVNLEGWIKTFSVTDAGDITTSWIDTFEFTDADGYKLDMGTIFTINDAETIASHIGVYGVAFKEADTKDGKVCAINITNVGIITDGTCNGVKTFDNVNDLKYRPHVIFMGGDYYLFTYTDFSYDGFLRTMDIETWNVGESANPPVISDEYPSDGSIGISTVPPTCHIKVTDADGDTTNITFATNVTGVWVTMQNNNGVASGSTVNWVFAGANQYNHTYWWRVYANDSVTNVSETYSFRTFYPGNFSVGVYNESNCSQLLTFDILISNKTGTETFEQKNCYGFLSINISQCPHGNDTIVLISADDYNFRIAYLDLEIGSDLNRTFYLPPKNESYLYELSVYNEYDRPIEDAKIYVKRYINCTNEFENMSILYTDGAGLADVYLIPNTLYQFNISKSGFVASTSYLTPTNIVFTHRFVLTIEPLIPHPPIIDEDEISWVCTLLTNNSLKIVYKDNSGYTISAIMKVSTYNSTTGWATIGTYTYTTQTWTRFITNLNRSRDYVINLTYNNLYLGINHRAFVLYQNISKPTNESETNTVFDWVGTITFGASNFFMWMFLIASMYYCDERDAGIMLIVIGVIFLIIDAYLGFSNIIMTFMGGVVPFLFIVIGILLEWGESKRRSM